MRCVQGAWGVKSKPAGVRRTRSVLGTQDAGQGQGHGGAQGCAALAWGVLRPRGRASGPAVPLPFAATEGPRRSLPSLSYLLCWARLLSLPLNFLTLSVNCAKVNLENKDRT